MRNIAEQTILLRDMIELPDVLKLTKEEFCEGWSFIRSVNARQLGKQITAHEWNQINIADRLQHSGVGGTQQEALANALRLSLRHIGEFFNAAEVENIELTQYPWFHLARIRIYPSRIQESSVLPVPDHYEPVPVKPRQRRLPVGAEALYPHFGNAMPQLKQMLISSRTAQAQQE
jgi:hypothetical protein